jgi:hypothetical protein
MAETMTLLQIVPGDTFTYEVTVREPSDVVGLPGDQYGEPYDLTSCTLFFAVKREIQDTAYVASLYWEDGGDSEGITVADPTTGEAVVELTPAETAVFDQWAHKWDLQLRNAGGKVRTIDSGSLIVLRQVNSATAAP